jgi:hypothetical protein
MVNKETHRKAHSTNIQHLNTDGITTNYPQIIAETFNNHFTSVAENVRTTNRNTYIQNTNAPDATDNDIPTECKRNETIKVCNISKYTNNNYRNSTHT